MLLASSQQIREADRIMIEDLGFPGLLLMETAGRKSAEAILERHADLDRVVILCGPGNNGGDGLVIARYLKLAGKTVELILSHPPERYGGDAAVNFAGLNGSGIPWRIWDGSMPNTNKALLVDALLGTGIKAGLRGPIQEMVASFRDFSGPVLAVDLPSGLDADTGHAFNPVIPADFTLTFQTAKVCHWVGPAADACGEVVVADIGIWPEVVGQLGIERGLITGNWVRQAMSRRPRSGHKGTFGHALLLGGSRAYAGAIALSGHSALHVGAGLSTVFGPQAAREASLAMGPEVICHVTEGDWLGGGDVEAWKEMAKGKSIGMGPGMGQDAETKRFLMAALGCLDAPVVLDADALNLLSGEKEWWNRIPKGSVLTPHPGEMKRLTGRGDVNDFRMEATEELAEQTGCVVVLKGAGTIVALGKGKSMVNPSGNEGMATGGSGDVLTGAVTGFMAQGYSPATAATMGVYVHGLAGDLAKAKYGSHGVTAGRILQELGPAIQQIINQEEPKYKTI